VQRLDLSPNEHRFHAVMNDDQVIIANQVVVAVGFKYFKHLPVELSQVVPAGRLSHTCDLVDFAALRGKRCLILGGRQSAFEWAALIHEAGAAAVHVCHRHDSPAFKASDWSWATPLVNTVVHQPAWFRNLFAEEQEDLHQRLWAEGRLKVEPWLERRVLHETIKLWPRTRVIEVTAEPDGELAVKLDNGQRLVVDHIIAATGYKVDIARVPFLAEGNLFPRVAIRNGYPVLDEHFQTSVRGLFITSMAAAQDFGPFWAFTIAAPASAKIIGHALLSSKSFA
jgi:thioredoxin reductase